MNYDIIYAEARKEFRLFIRFADGLSGEVDVSYLVDRGVFKAWKKPGFFQKVFVDPDMQTVCWPGGLDLAPDALYEKIVAMQKRKRKAA